VVLYTNQLPFVLKQMVYKCLPKHKTYSRKIIDFNIHFSIELNNLTNQQPTLSPWPHILDIHNMYTWYTCIHTDYATVKKRLYKRFLNTVMTYRPTYLRQKQFGLGWIFDKGINITRDSSLIRRNLIHRQMIHIFNDQKAHIQLIWYGHHICQANVLAQI
jgi:hypothetical protein